MEISLHRKEPGKLFPTDILHQTFYWSSVKSRLGWNRYAFDFFAEDKYSDILVLTKKINDNRSIAYVPQGPEVLPDSVNEYGRGIYLETLSEQIASHLPSSCVFIRYDLPWETPYASDPSRFDSLGYWTGCPGPEVREMRMNMGSSFWNVRKAPTDIQPPDTIIISLENSSEKMLEKMKSKTRYNIRLSRRKGVIVYEAGEESLPEWYELYRKTAERNRFRCHGIEYFQALFSVEKEISPDTSIHLLMARAGRRILAGIIVSISRKRATYLFGASSGQMRSFMAPYALQWEAMRFAKARGCVGYDMFGVSPHRDENHPLFGLYRFKTGFGGSMVHRQGCWDYPLLKKEYELYASRESLSQAFHL